MRNHSPHLYRSGFSILEIVVASAVVLILAGVLTSTMMTVRKKAERAACLNNLRQLSVATVGFTQENSGYMPDLNWWAQELLPYVPSRGPRRDVFWCPSATTKECPVDASRTLSVYPDNKLIPISYGINGNYPSNSGQILVGNRGTRIPERRMLTVPQPQKVVLYLDQCGGYANIFFDTYERFSRRHAATSDQQRMQLNAAFVDGHVEPIDISYNTNPRSPWRGAFDAVW